MKVIHFIICTIFSANILAQEIATFYTPKSNSLLLDFCQREKETYLLIDNQNDSVFGMTDEMIFDDTYATTLIKKVESKYEFILGYNLIDKEYAQPRVFFVENEVFFTLSSNSDFELNNIKYKVIGENYNFFMFKIDGNISLVYHLYNDAFDVFPEVFVDLESVNFMFYIPKPVIYTNTGDSISAANNNGKYEGYSFLCTYTNGGFDLIDDFAMNFFGTDELKYRAGISYKYQQGVGALLSSLCNGMQFFRSDVQIATTDSFDIKHNVFYPITEFHNTSVKPLSMLHDSGYSARLEGFYKLNNQWTFYFNPLFAKEFCFKEQCLENEQVSTTLRTQLVNYNWIEGEGKLTLYPENHNFSIRSCKNINDEIFFLAAYQGNPGFLRNRELYFGNKSLSNLFIAKINGENIGWPIIIRSIEFDFAYIDFFNENQFKFINHEFFISGKFGAGVIFDTDSINAKSKSDMYYLSIPQKLVSVNEDVANGFFNVYPNPATNHLSVSGLENNRDFFYYIHTPLGQEIMKGELEKANINIAVLQKGFYILSIAQKDAKAHVSYFIKQ